MVLFTSRQSVSLVACAADQFYITTLYTCITRKIFPGQNIYSTLMKEGDVKNVNQMKSSFFLGNLSPMQGKARYHISHYCKINKSIKYSFVASK